MLCQNSSTGSWTRICSSAACMLWQITSCRKQTHQRILAAKCRGLSRGGNAVTAVTSADQSENVCAFSHGQPVCMKPFCVNFLLQPVSTDTFSKTCGHRNNPNERMRAVSITSVLRSFAAYIRTSNGIYSTCRHSSGTYVHGESP